MRWLWTQWSRDNFKSKYEDVYLNLKTLREYSGEEYEWRNDYSWTAAPNKEIVYRYKVEVSHGIVFISSYYEKYKATNLYTDVGDSELIISEFDFSQGTCKVEETIVYDLTANIYEHNQSLNGIFNDGKCNYRVLRNHMNLTNGLILECENCNRAKSIGQLNKQKNGRYISW